MNYNIKDYPEEYWIGALICDAFFNTLPLIISIYCFIKERKSFFHDKSFRNEAKIEYYKNKDLNLNSERHLVQTNKNTEENISEQKIFSRQAYINTRIADKPPVVQIKEIIEEKNNIPNSNPTGKENQFNVNFVEEIDEIERLAKKKSINYKWRIKFTFTISILTMIIDFYSNISTISNLKPRFLNSQFVLFNKTYLVNANHLIYDRYSIINREIKNKIRDLQNKFQNPNQKYFSFKKNNGIFYKEKKFKENFSEKETKINSKNIYFNKINIPKNKSKYEPTIRLLSEYDKPGRPEYDFIFSNIENYTKIYINSSSLNISRCKYYQKKDLEKIDLIYKFSGTRYSLLIINTIVDIFVILLTAIGFLYVVQLNELYSLILTRIILFLLNKCWSICAVSYSYFDFNNDCLNSIEYFDVFYYAFLTYAILFGIMLGFFVLYSIFCRQLLYYILFIFISILTIFSPLFFCFKKFTNFLEKIYIMQSFKIKDDLMCIKNKKLCRESDNIQLLLSYILIFLILVTGLAALVNYGILKYIWIKNSVSTFVPAFTSVISALIGLFLDCFR